MQTNELKYRLSYDNTDYSLVNVTDVTETTIIVLSNIRMKELNTPSIYVKHPNDIFTMLKVCMASKRNFP